MEEGKILLDHGSGGELTNRLINEIFLSAFSAGIPAGQTDGAVLEMGRDLMVFTSDSYVVNPCFFPGGDIGKLSVCGTVNDLAVSGSIPRFLSASFILEEGFPMEDLKRIVKSQAAAAKIGGVKIVCGDTKVVERGACDRIFISTSGIGQLEPRFRGISTAAEVEEGDVLLVSGPVGNHGTAVLSARENLPFRSDLVSDCAPLAGMIQKLLGEVPEVRFMRDATRGGLATVLAEFAEMTELGAVVEEEEVPITGTVKGLTEILGLDPLYLANEGTILIVTKAGTEGKAREILRSTPHGRRAQIIGRVVKDHPGHAVLRTRIGGSRRLYRLSGQQLPRIC